MLPRILALNRTSRWLVASTISANADFSPFETRSTASSSLPNNGLQSEGPRSVQTPADPRSLRSATRPVAGSGRDRALDPALAGGVSKRNENLLRFPILSQSAPSPARLGPCLIGWALLACASGPPPPKASAAGKPARQKASARELSPAEVAFALRGREEELRDCFRGSTAHGIVSVTWQIDAAGKPQEVEIDRSSVEEAAVEECLLDRVRGLHFDAPARHASAHWAFVYGLRDFVRDLPMTERERRRQKEAERRRKQKRKDDDDADEPGVEVERSSPGFLSPVAIDNVVQAGYSLFARCYRDGIRRDPALGGVIRVRFAIESDGSVAAVWNFGSELSDQEVIDCVAEGFFALRFPEPERGRVHVRYRLRLDSG